MMVGSNLQISLVAAVDECRVIGHQGQLPWHLPADLRHFKSVTMGHPLVMGRKTHESIGEPLPGRENIVLSRNPDFQAPGCTVADSLPAAFEHAEALGADRAMVIGGQEVFRQALPQADRMELTLVAGCHAGDAFFPRFDENQWEIVDSRVHGADEDNESTMVFVTLCATVEPPRIVESSNSEGQLPELLRRQLHNLQEK